MGIMDSIKGLFGGNKDKGTAGTGTTAGVVDDKAGAHDDDVPTGADVANDAADNTPE